MTTTTTHICSGVFMVEFCSILKRLSLAWSVSHYDLDHDLLTIVVAVTPDWWSPWIPAPRDSDPEAVIRYQFAGPVEGEPSPVHAQWASSPS